jgi:hypothetical protein
MFQKVFFRYFLTSVYHGMSFGILCKPSLTEKKFNVAMAISDFPKIQNLPEPFWSV